MTSDFVTSMMPQPRLHHPRETDMVALRHQVRRVAWSAVMCASAAICLAVTGCGPNRARPVDVDLARVTLTTVLEHWKQKGAIDELRQVKPEIVVQEPLWANGNRLLEFNLIDQGRKENANWYCEVELTLESTESGKSVKKKVTYVVGTDPVLTVFHAIL